MNKHPSLSEVLEEASYELRESDPDGVFPSLDSELEC